MSLYGRLDVALRPIWSCHAAPLAAAVVASGAAASKLTLGGVVVGDVTARQAVLWARPNAPTTLRVKLFGGRRVRVVRMTATTGVT